MKKGFTLIELLAVIVILAIIALISVPIIARVVTAAKEKSFVLSVEGILDAAELKLSTNELGLSNDAIDLSTLSYKGKKYTNGAISVDESSNIAIAVWNEDLGLCVTKNYTDQNASIDKSKTLDNCTVGSETINLTSADDEYKCFTFNPDTKTILKIGGDTCTTTSLHIPTTIDGIMVEHIGSFSLDYSGYTSEIQLLDFTAATGLLTINYRAVSGSWYIRVLEIKGIEKLKLLTTIGDFAFSGNEIINIIIPSNVVSIGEGSFSRNDIASLTLNENLTTIGYRAFERNQISTVIIPNSVTSISDYAFIDNVMNGVTIKGKTSPTDFTVYGEDIWGWADGYTDSNIIWNG